MAFRRLRMSIRRWKLGPKRLYICRTPRSFEMPGKPQIVPGAWPESISATPGHPENPPTMTQTSLESVSYARRHVKITRTKLPAPPSIVAGRVACLRSAGVSEVRSNDDSRKPISSLCVPTTFMPPTRISVQVQAPSMEFNHRFRMPGTFEDESNSEGMELKEGIKSIDREEKRNAVSQEIQQIFHNPDDKLTVIHPTPGEIVPFCSLLGITSSQTIGTRFTYELP